MKVTIILSIFFVAALINVSCRYTDSEWVNLDNSQRVEAQNKTAQTLSSIWVDEIDIVDMNLVDAVKLLEQKLQSKNEGIAIRVDQELPKKFPQSGKLKPFYDNTISVRATNIKLLDLLGKMLSNLPGAVYEIRSKEIVILHSSYVSLDICMHRELSSVLVADLDKVKALNLELLVNLMNSTLNRCGDFSINIESFFSEKVDLKNEELPVGRLESLRIIDICDLMENYYGGQWLLDGDTLYFSKNRGNEKGVTEELRGVGVNRK